MTIRHRGSDIDAPRHGVYDTYSEGQLNTPWIGTSHSTGQPRDTSDDLGTRAPEDER